MPNEQLLNYIKTQLNNGVSIETIKITLLQSGWKFHDVDAGISEAQQLIQKDLEKPSSQINQEENPTTKNEKQTDKKEKRKDVPQEALKNFEEAIDFKISKETNFSKKNLGNLDENQELKIEIPNSIKKKLEKGESKISIAATLKNSGWEDSMINEVIGTHQKTPKEKKKKVKFKNIKEEENNSTKKITTTENIDYSVTFAEILEKTIKKWCSLFFTIIGIHSIPIFLFTTIIILVKSGIINTSSQITIPRIFVGLFSILIIEICAQTANLYSLTKNEKNIIKSYENSFNRIFPLIFSFITFIGIMISGTIFLIIPAIIFSTWFIFFPFVIVDQNVSGAEALTQSRKLVKGIFGKLFFQTLIIVIITTLSLILINSIFLIVYVGINIIVEFLISLFQVTITFILINFPIIFLSTFYENIKDKKENSINTKNFIIITKILSWLGYILIIVTFGIMIFFISNSLMELIGILTESGELNADTLKNLIEFMN